VLLVFQLGQPAPLMAMSRDGLLPKILFLDSPAIFARPGFRPFLTGFVVAIPRSL
jgi:hypothetical protein